MHTPETVSDRSYSRVAPRRSGRITRAALLLWAVLTGAFLLPASAFDEYHLDPSFGSGGIVTVDVHPRFREAFGLQMLPDGKLLVAGSYIEAGSYVLILLRYLPDGSLDPSFGVGGVLHGPSSAVWGYALMVHSDGGIFVGGHADQSAFVYRFTADGFPDSGWGDGGRVELPVCQFGGQIEAMSEWDEGRILAAGSTACMAYAGSDRFIYCLHPDGTLDTSFGAGGLSQFGYGYETGGMCFSGGGIVLTGTWTSAYGDPHPFSTALSRTLSQGALDPCFAYVHHPVPPPDICDAGVAFVGESTRSFAVTEAPDGSLVTAGGAYPSGRQMLARVSAGGFVIAEFGSGGVVTTNLGAPAADVLCDPEGRIITACGPGIRMLRFLSDGTLDLSFNGTGVVTTDLDAVGVKLIRQSDGRFVELGDAPTGFHLVRYAPGDGLLRPCCDPATGNCSLTAVDTCLFPSLWHPEWTSCSPNPCAPAVGACCDTWGSCTLRAWAECQPPSTWNPAWTSCQPNPCPAACCSPLDGGCSITSQTGCLPPGIWHGDEVSCAPSPCPQLAVCCDLADGCSVTLEADCPAPAVWYAELTACAPNPCPLGACCDAATGNCVMTIESRCGEPGLWYGDVESCVPNPCPFGACCDATTGTCEITTELACPESSNWNGDLDSCLPNPCAQPGACCSPYNICSITVQFNCLWQDGWLGAGTTCSPDPCPSPDYGGPLVAIGSNGSGQCTIPEPNDSFVAAAGGSAHSLGLRANGSIAAWGRNSDGQCDVPPGVGFMAAAAGPNHSLGLTTAGSVLGWGANGSGACTAPEPNSSFIAISAGTYYSLGLKMGGTLRQWGIGIGELPSNSDFVAISAGSRHALALRANGSIAAWGTNTNGQCDVPEPNSGFIAIAGGGLHSLGLRSDGSIAAWGRNTYGQCTVPSPNSGFVKIAAGYDHSVALRSNGTIAAWGRNDSHQCGPWDPDACYTDIAAGSNHSMGLWRGGACCLPDGACTITLASDCTGNWYGLAQECLPSLCAMNQEGALVFHVNGQLSYPSGGGGYCGQSGLSDCAAAVTTASGADPVIVYILAAFPLSSTPRMTGISFGLDYDIDTIGLLEWDHCGDWQDATIGWPTSGAGVRVTWSAPQTSPLTEVYWFAAYSYLGASSSLRLVPHPDLGATVSNDLYPGHVDSLACLGVLGFNTAGGECCGSPGACCRQDGSCVVASEANCGALGGEFVGVDTPCEPNPCEVSAVLTPDLTITSVALSMPTPNPASREIRFYADLPTGGMTRLWVADVSGRTVRNLVDGMLPAGRHPFSLESGDGAATHLPSGVYTVVLETSGRRLTRRVVVLR